MNKVSPAQEIPGVSDTNSLNKSPDARSGTNLTDEMEPPEGQFVHTPEEIENSEADASENGSLVSIETEEQPIDQGVISPKFTTFEENGMRVCLSREDIIQGTPDRDITTDVPINNSPTIAPMPISKLNSSADFFLPPPPTENEIYSTDTQEIPTELSNMTNLSKSPDTKSETSVKSDSQEGVVDQITGEIAEEIQGQPFVQGSLSQFTTFAGYDITHYYTGGNITIGSRVVERLKQPENAVLGTIISVNESGKEVQVLWDNSIDGKSYSYSTGKDNNFHLLLFDNAQTGVEHASIACEECDEYPLRGIRWNCLNCDDSDLCSSCYMSNKHDDSHIFTRFESEDSKGVEMEARYDVQVKHSIGIQKGAEILLRKDEKISGQIIKIHKEDGTAARSDAIVKWGKDGRTQHSVCRKGKCELMALTKTKGPHFYEDHLPFVSKEYAKLGIRVVMASTGYMENNRDGYIGTIVSCEKKTNEEWHVQVQWDDSTELSYHNLSELKIFDNGPAGIDHDCFCMECFNPVIGMRWKCLECQVEIDSLCTECYMLNKHTEDQHQFLRIVEPSSKLADQITLNNRRKATKKQSYGIFKGAKVSQIPQGYF